MPITKRVNSYIATLLITIAGAGAALFILRVANAEQSAAAPETAGSYANLQQFILNAPIDGYSGTAE